MAYSNNETARTLSGKKLSVNALCAISPTPTPTMTPTPSVTPTPTVTPTNTVTPTPTTSVSITAPTITAANYGTPSSTTSNGNRTEDTTYDFSMDDVNQNGGGATISYTVNGSSLTYEWQFMSYYGWVSGYCSNTPTNVTSITWTGDNGHNDAVSVSSNTLTFSSVYGYYARSGYKGVTGWFRLKVSNSAGTVYSGWVRVVKHWNVYSYNCNCNCPCGYTTSNCTCNCGNYCNCGNRDCCSCDCSGCCNGCCDENNENCYCDCSCDCTGCCTCGYACDYCCTGCCDTTCNCTETCDTCYAHYDYDDGSGYNNWCP